VFTTKDGGQLFIGVTSDQQWLRFLEEFNLQKLREDPRLATNGSRVQERSWLIPKLLEAIGALSLDDVSARCERANVLWAPVGKPQDLHSDTHLPCSCLARLPPNIGEHRKGFDARQNGGKCKKAARQVH